MIKFQSIFTNGEDTSVLTITDDQVIIQAKNIVVVNPSKPSN